MAYSGYRAYLSVNQGSVRDKNISYAKKVAQADFMHSPNYFQVNVLIPSTPLSTTPLDVWIIDDSDTKNQKEIIAYPDQIIDLGYLVYWKDQYWLTLSDDNLGDIYSRGIALRCYDTLKWLDLNGTVRESWFCMQADTSSNFGVEDGRILVMPNERRTIIIQKNIYTTQINKDKRFIIDGRAWRTISIDRIKDGIITLTIEEDQIDTSRDNLELRIADYYNNIHVKTLEILNGTSAELSNSETLQLEVLIKDNSEVISESVSYSSSDVSIIIVDDNGLITCVSEGSATVTVTLNSDSSVFDTISIVVTALTINDNFELSINGSSICQVGQTQTYESIIRNNGVIDTSESVTWQLFADNQTSSTTLATIASQDDDSCVVQGNSNQKYGYIQLKATLNSDPSIAAYKRIYVKGIL